MRERIPRRVRVSFLVLGLVVTTLLGALVALSRRPVGGAFVADPAVPVGSPVAYVSPVVPEPAMATGVPVPSVGWVARVATATGIPSLALAAYAAAQLATDAGDPACGLGWNTLAGIGAVESDHGRHDGSRIDPDGVVRPTVVGPPLDGTGGNLAVPDTDGGALDGDTVWDRAVGPMQFVPATWALWGRSATGGVPDPNDVDDAALTAAAYLCAAGTDMTTTAGWTAAIGSYNAPPEYAALVAGAANSYAAAAR